MEENLNTTLLSPKHISSQLATTIDQSKFVLLFVWPNLAGENGYYIHWTDNCICAASQ